MSVLFVALDVDSIGVVGKLDTMVGIVDTVVGVRLLEVLKATLQSSFGSFFCS